ncbi:MAG TPA: hypothetical protein VHF27_01750 [Acidimicrobiales bacterium]|nr:hypothetical protein [Acidimicrobiales bacterium]
MRRSARVLLAAAAVVLAVPEVVGAHPVQHGSDEGHLEGSGGSGNLQLLSFERVTDKNDLVADVAVSPDGKWAYLANWGEPDCAGPERGGQTSPDAGAWVVDISDLTDPKTVGFIPSHQDSRPGEGMQVVHLTTSSFSGDVLVMNNEQCGKNGKGGVSLFDVSNPRKPVRLSEHFGDRGHADANEIHSAFAWDAGDRAYVVMTDNLEFPDVDILDITNPRRPRKIAEYDMNALGVSQPELGLVQSQLHDMIVKQIDGRFIMLLSYWDGGYIQLDVTDPANAVFLGQTQFAFPDPQLLESTGVALAPEGNAHQAEYTLDNEMFIATDEDFAPYGATDFAIATGPFQGAYPSVPVPGSAPVTVLADDLLNGPVAYGGYGCPGSAPIPSPGQIPGYAALVGPGEEKIVVLQRGPAGDPSATEPACFPGEKAHQAAEAGWDAVLFVQRHGGTESPPLCGSGAFVDEIVGVCTNHEAFHRLFATPPYDAASWTYPDGPAIGAIGERVTATAKFDGWGYVHLFDRQTGAELDTYAIPEAHDPAYATGYGDLTVHEVATDPQHPRRAYLSYYSGGMRALEIQCASADESSCEMVEVGSYLDHHGNDFWGVEAFVRDGTTYVLGSDRDSGLWVFKVTG